MAIAQKNRFLYGTNRYIASFTVATHPAPARVALMGNVTFFWRNTDMIEDHDDKHGLTHKSLEECFLKRHGDAKSWIPGNFIWGDTYWAHTIYYVGGFGSEDYNGLIPLRTYQEVRQQRQPTNENVRISSAEAGP